jgi:hypothetical protein
MQQSTGYVYVCNAYVQALRLYVNNALTPPIAAVPAPGSSPAPYQPFEIEIQRVLPPSVEPGFLDGQENSITVELKGGRQSDVAYVPVPAVGASTDDLWLYVTYELLLLFSTQGKVAARTELEWT